MRHLLAYIMLTIFSFQVLPIKELGRLLSKGQFTEEVHNNCHEEIVTKFKGNLPFKEFPVSYVDQQVYLEKQVNNALHKAALIAHQHFPDIFVPPPNA